MKMTAPEKRSSSAGSEASLKPLFLRHLALFVSLLIHGLIILALGAVVVIQRSSPASGEFEAASLQPAPQDIVEQPPPEAVEPIPSEPDPTEQDSANASSMAENSAANESPPAAATLITTLAPAPAFTMLSGNGSSFDPNASASGSGDGRGGGGGRAGKGTGRLFGVQMATRNEGLVVYLDNSGSMQAVAAKVRALVEAEFPKAAIFTLRGALFAEDQSMSKLKRELKGNDYMLSYYQTMLPSSIIPKCTEYLQTLATPPEAVYMLSDFDDYVDPHAVEDFSKELLSKNIKFYAHSVGKHPAPSIAHLCQESGGAVLMVPADKLPEPVAVDSAKTDTPKDPTP